MDDDHVFGAHVALETRESPFHGLTPLGEVMFAGIVMLAVVGLFWVLAERFYQWWVRL